MDAIVRMEESEAYWLYTVGTNVSWTVCVPTSSVSIVAPLKAESDGVVVVEGSSGLGEAFAAGLLNARYNNSVFHPVVYLEKCIAVFL